MVFHSLKKWNTCTKCKIGEEAHKHVIGEGALPCDVLIVGEAPGVSEDTIGQPFIGKSGRVLRKAMEDWPRRVDYYITNLVACRPFGEDGSNRLPSREEVENCRPRLERIFEISRASSLILLGRTAQTFCNHREMKCNFSRILHVYHPAYILRNGGVEGDLYLEWKAQLTSFVKELQ